MLFGVDFIRPCNLTCLLTLGSTSVDQDVITNILQANLSFQPRASVEQVCFIVPYNRHRHQSFATLFRSSIAINDRPDGMKSTHELAHDSDSFLGH